MGKTQSPSKARRGWPGMVSAVKQQSREDDLRAYNQSILDMQCKIVAAEYGGIWIKDPSGDMKLIEVWPAHLNTGAGQDELPVFELLSEAAKGGFEREMSHVLKVDPTDSPSEPAGIGAHVFVTALKVQDQLAAISTVVADCRDPGVVQSTIPMRELAAGLYELFFARQETRKLAKETEQVRTAMALLATSQDAPGFKGACLNLVNELARQLKCTRVSLGWVRGKSVVLKAMSDTEDLKRHSEQVALIELAMSECLDQEQPIVFPTPEEAEPVLLEAIVHAHRRVIESTSNKHIASIPLRIADEWVGVITMERVDQPFDSMLVTQLQLVADVVAPHLRDRKISDRWLVGHAWNSTKKTASFVLGARHIGWKMLAVVLLAVLAFIIFGTWDYKVTSEFVLEIESKRIVSASLESDLTAVNVEPGDLIQKGALLATLNDRELRLQLGESQAAYNRANYEKDQYLADPNKTNEYKQALARMQEAKARIELLDYQINRAKIESPISGVVLQGDWKDKVGGVIKKGDPMFEVASLDEVVAVLRVGEADIDQIQQYVQEHGGKLPLGRLATRARPEIKFDLQVEKIIPLAGPHNNNNVFEVRAKLTNPQPWLRPGMEGLARVEVGKEPIYWIISHRVVDSVRLWLWY